MQLMRVTVTLVAFAAAVLTLACSSSAASARFTTAEGRQSTLRITDFEGIRHPRLAPSEGVTATGVFRTRRSLIIVEGQAFYLQYHATVAEAFISFLGDGDHELVRHRLTAGGDLPVRVYVSVPAGRLRGFRIWTANTTGTLDLAAAGIATPRRGVALIEGVLEVGVDAQFPPGTKVDAGGLIHLKARLRTPRTEPQPGLSLGIRTSFTPLASDGTGELVLSVSGSTGGAEQQATAKVSLTAGERSIHLHEAILGFVPVEVQEITHTGGTLRFLTIKHTTETEEPLPADLDTILTYPQNGWRSNDWEVFRWNAVPEVLIFDTASYLIQEELFRRLAYYVEKAGFRGFVWSDDELGNRYGYNAHDYAAADLARFFTDAEQSSVQLNTRELWLRDFLIQEGIIRAADGSAPQEPGWQANNPAGVVLSISRSSSPAHRALLLRHEAAHGIYFVHAGYRDQIHNLWQEIGEPARHAWRSYLSALAYDTASEELVRNEFQAYLAHNREHSLEYYFGELVPSRIRYRLPNEELASKWFENESKTIRSHYKRVDRALQMATGMHAGQMATVTIR